MYTYTYVCIYTYIHIYIYTHLYLSIYISICLSVYLSISISIYLPISLSLSISISLSLYLSIYLSVCSPPSSSGSGTFCPLPNPGGSTAAAAGLGGLLSVRCICLVVVFVFVFSPNGHQWKELLDRIQGRVLGGGFEEKRGLRSCAHGSGLRYAQRVNEPTRRLCVLAAAIQSGRCRVPSGTSGGACMKHLDPFLTLILLLSL